MSLRDNAAPSPGEEKLIARPLHAKAAIGARSGDYNIFLLQLSIASKYEVLSMPF